MKNCPTITCPSTVKNRLKNSLSHNVQPTLKFKLKLPDVYV